MTSIGSHRFESCYNPGMLLISDPQCRVVLAHMVFLAALLPAGCAKSEAPAKTPQPTVKREAPKETFPTVRAFLNEYFESWTEADFYAYEACFDREAVIQYRNPSGKLTTYDLPTFIRGQAKVHQKGDGKSEIPLSMDIKIEDGRAKCLVRWKLTRPGGSKTGYDEFVLVPDGDSWRIISLLFYYE